MDEPHLRVRKLSAGYGGRLLLEDLELDLPVRRVSVILGPGGSGKSTLLRALAGATAARFGLSVHGDLGLPAEDPCFLAQGLARSDSTVADLLRHGRCGGRRCRWARTHPEAIAEDASPGELRRFAERFWSSAPGAAVALEQILEARTKDVPAGLLRLAAFTATASHGAPYLLLDEPTADMAPREEDWVAGKICELGRERTIVLITRNLRVARSVAEHVVLLVEGKVLEAGAAKAFFESPRHPRTLHFIRMGC